MKLLVIIILGFSSISFSQLTLEQANDSLRKYQIGSYSYHETFSAFKGYGAPVILTTDGGATAFGSWYDEKEFGECALLLKLDSTGTEEWKSIVPIKANYISETEPQSVVQDALGNYFVFMLMYSKEGYSGGAERVMMFDKTGKKVWDIMLSKFTLLNNPTISYIRSMDGKIYLRGHIVTEKQVEGQDPVYRFWEGWIDTKGVLTQKAGDVIHWEDQTWQDLYKPE